MGRGGGPPDPHGPDRRPPVAAAEFARHLSGGTPSLRRPAALAWPAEEPTMDPISLEAMAQAVPDGALVAMPPDNSLPAVSLAKALIRRGARGLRLVGVPVSGFATDILIGAGCVAEVQTSAASLGEAGFAPRFSAAVRENKLRVLDATCPAIHTMLQASEKGVPFMPLRGVIGSDILAHRPDWCVV